MTRLGNGRSRSGRFNIPITMNVPPEVSTRISERVTRDVDYVTMKQERIKNTYENINITNLRKVGDYLWSNFSKELSIKEISRTLKIGEGSVKLLIADLNFWSEYPLKMVPIPKKAGYIQNSMKSPEITEKYLKKKARTISTMEQVYENVDLQMQVKKPKKARRKQKVVEKE